MTTALTRAAAARGASNIRAADRPQQRRCSGHPDAAPVAVTRSPAGLQLRAKDTGKDAGDTSTALEFNGYASVTDAGYEMYDFFGPFTEVVSPGAFERTLAAADLDVPLVLAHDSLRRIARTTNGTLQLSEDDTGLQVRAAELDPADADVAYIAPKIRAGLVDEMSFKFWIVRGQWSPEWDEYHIEEVDIHRGDVAIVGYGANPFTSSNLRSAVDKVQHGGTLDARDVETLSRALSFVADLDPVVEQARTALAAFVEHRTPAEAGAVDETGDLAREALSALRSQERTVRARLRDAGQAPAMTLQDLLRI